METIQKNYKLASEIEKELKDVDLENFLDFDGKGGFDFDSCDYCNGPVLGHLEVKCPRLEYDPGDVRKFEKHLKKNKGLKKALMKREEERIEKEKAHELKMKEVEAKAMAEMMRSTFEGLGNAGNAQGTTQLVKSRQPPLWTGQQFDRWRLEIEMV